MNLWIVTIGSSDVQLVSDRVNQEQGRTEQQRSDKAWNYWYTDELKADCYDIEFVPKSLFKGKDESYRIAPRILGRVYNASPAKVQQEIWDYLTFPLMDNFWAELAHYPLPGTIAILLTDQSAIFEFDRQRSKPKSPYWQDTYELKSILETYFQQTFPSVPCEYLTLDPTASELGLDHWDFALNLVEAKFKTLNIAGNEIALKPHESVYVSHQAGTPAISSAVQFVSLATFGDRVKFLVSNEQDKTLTGIVESSAYLRGIKREQAKKLLDRHDYSGIKTLIGTYLDNETQDNETQILLEAAIQWNFAKFDEFAAKIKSSSSNQMLVQQVKERSQHWWWTAYESAYLAMVRLKQENTVEAMFHSFRALEGLAIKYVERNGSSGKYGRKAFSSLRHQKRSEWNRHPYIRTLIDLDTPEQERNDLLDKRNNLFHQLQGFHKGDLFNAWTADASNWQEKALGCLNFISGETFEFLDKEGSDGRVASLIVKVHQELEKAIAQL